MTLPNLTALLARDINGVIGVNNDLPWSIKSDLKRFKDLTIDTTVIMGRKTYESLPMYPRGLPNRKNIVISSTLEGNDHITVFKTVQEVIDFIDENYLDQFSLIGGEAIYKELLPSCSVIMVTEVQTELNTTGAETVSVVNDNFDDYFKHSSGVVYKEEGDEHGYTLSLYIPKKRRFYVKNSCSKISKPRS